LKLSGEIWIFAAEGFHAGGETLSIERIDGEGAVTALRATGAADEPGAGAARCICERGIHNLHKFAIACRKFHAAKDTG
jgi:hypothetical protein